MSDKKTPKNITKKNNSILVNSPQKKGKVTIDKSGAIDKTKDIVPGSKSKQIRHMASASVVRTQPKIYSPLYQVSNLQLPRDQKTINSWCFAAGTKVILANGLYKNIEDIEPGDLILTHTKTIAPVANLLRRKKNGLCKIKVKGIKNSITVTQDHIFRALLRRENICKANNDNMCTFGNKKSCHKPPYACRYQLPSFKIREIAVKNLEPGDYVIYPINQKEDNKDNWCNEDLARLLGLYSAEGSISEGQRQVGLTFNMNEDDLIHEAQDLFEKCFQKRGCRYLSTKDSIERVYTTNSIAREALLKHSGKGSKTKKFSDEVMNLPKELQLIIIGGYFDGDGYFSNKDLNADTASEDLAHQIQYMCWRNEINTYVSKYTRKQTIGNHIGEDTDFWRIRLPYRGSNKLNKYCNKIEYKSLSRIRSDRFFYNGYLCAPIEKIKLVDEEIVVYDLVVDHEDHTFTTEVGVVNNCRHFYATNPIIRNAVNLHATYPISKFQIKCKDRKVENFFNDMFEKMNFQNLLLEISLEYWKHGECMPYLELDDTNGVWDYGFVHNPDFVRVKTNVLAKDPIISMVPDDALRRLVNAQSPADIKLRNQLPREVMQHLQRGEDIPLPNFNVSHIKYLNAPYDVRGTSLISACFLDLMLYDKIREAKYTQADDFINPMTLVKLGDPNGNWKPNDDDIRQFQETFIEATFDLDYKLITHGAVTVEMVGRGQATMDVSSDFERAIQNIMIGMMVPPAILDQDYGSYASSYVSMRVLEARYENFRNALSRWIQTKVMAPISKIQDFYEVKGGEEKLIVPEVVWNKLNLKDVESYMGIMQGLLAAPGDPTSGKVSTQSFFDVADLDYKTEQQRLRKEAIDEVVRQKEFEALQKMSLEELRTQDPNKPINDIHEGEAPPSDGAPGEEGEDIGLEGLDLGSPPSGGGGGSTSSSAESGEEGGGETTPPADVAEPPIETPTPE